MRRVSLQRPLMLTAGWVEPGMRVLEIGTGTGFNAALLSKLVGSSGSVTTVEIDPDLAKVAQERLARAGFEQVHIVLGDATVGIADGSSFDRVISTASVHLGRIPRRRLRARLR